MATRRLPVGLLLMGPVLAGLAIYAFTMQGTVADAGEGSATPTETATQPWPGATVGTDYDATMIAGQQTAAANYAATQQVLSVTSTPMARRGDFQKGAWVRVNAGAGDCLNARNGPSLQTEYVIVYNCLPHGFEGLLTSSAVEADGRWWWYLAGAGWVAEEYLAYVRNADLRQPMAPEIAAAGRIAFVREGDIWLMNADGSDQRKIVELGGGVDENEEYGWRPYPRDLTWSPDGTKLAFGMTGKGDGVSAPPEELHIVSWSDDGTIVDAVYAGLVGGGWSPDSTRIGIVRDAEYDPMGSGATGLPGVLDVRDGRQTILRSERTHQQRAPSFSADGTMLLATGLAVNGATEGPAFAVWDLDGNELYALAQPAAGFFARPRWSPAEPKVAFHVSENDRPGYAVTTPDGALLARIDAPRASDKIGGRCGGANMWRTDWSLDGRQVLFSFDMGDTGANGIWIWDIGSGEQRLVPAANAGPAAAGPDGRFAFESWASEEPYIFIGDVSGGFPRLLTDGGSPAWAPV